MAKNQKRIQQQQEQRSQQQYDTGLSAQKRLIDGSPEFQARQAQLAARNNYIQTGTIADDKNFVSNKDAVAERAMQFERRQNLTDTGIAGLAANYTNPTQIALAKQMSKDEFGRDSAAQTSADAKQYINDTRSMEDNIINQKIGIDSGIMGTAFGASQSQIQLAAQIASQRASVLPGILGMALGAAGQVASGGMAGGWFARRPSGNTAPSNLGDFNKPYPSPGSSSGAVYT